MGVFWLFPPKEAFFNHKTTQKNRKKRMSNKASVVNEKKTKI
jgi:hypothetical protein